MGKKEVRISKGRGRKTRPPSLPPSASAASPHLGSFTKSLQSLLGDSKLLPFAQLLGRDLSQARFHDPAEDRAREVEVETGSGGGGGGFVARGSSCRRVCRFSLFFFFVGLVDVFRFLVFLDRLVLVEFDGAGRLFDDGFLLLLFGGGEFRRGSRRRRHRARKRGRRIRKMISDGHR